MVVGLWELGWVAEGSCSWDPWGHMGCSPLGSLHRHKVRVPQVWEWVALGPLWGLKLGLEPELELVLVGKAWWGSEWDQLWAWAAKVRRVSSD